MTQGADRGTKPLPQDRSSLDAALLALRSRPEPIPVDAAAQLLSDHYGIAAELTRLATEKDDTFIVAPTRRPHHRLLLKIESPLLPEAVPLLKATVASRVAAARPTIPVQQPVALTTGGFVGRYPGTSGTRAFSLSTFCEGELVESLPSRPDRLLTQIGDTLGRLQSALSQTEDPGAARDDVAWDLRLLPELHQQLSTHLPILQATDAPTLIAMVVSDFLTVRDEVNSAPMQLCHADFHQGNLVATPDHRHLAGVLDFGDAQVMPPVVDLATCLAYFIEPSEPDPLRGLRLVLHGYLGSAPTSLSASGHLPILIRCRLAAVILLLCWKASWLPPAEAEAARRRAGLRLDALRRLDPDMTGPWLDLSGLTSEDPRKVSP